MNPVLPLLLSLLAHSALTQTVQFIPPGSETLRNVILTDSKLLLGTSGAVYRTDLALTQEQRREMSSANRLLIADSPTGTLNGTVMACDEGSCYLLETRNLDNVKWTVSRSTVLLSGGGNALGSFSIGPNGTSDVLFGEPPNGVVGRRFVKGALKNVVSTNSNTFLRYATNQGNNPQGKVDYLKDTFLHSNYSFFTIQPDTDQIRTVRFCQRDPGFEGNFLVHYEIKLRCRTDDRDLVSSSATFGQTALGPRLFVTANYMADLSSMRSEVCTFSVDEINQLMLEKLTACASGSGNVGFGSQTAPCPIHFGESQRETQIREPCNLRSNLRSGLEVDSTYTRTPLITVSGGTEEFTSLLTLSLDDSLFLFAGTSTGSLRQYHVRSDSEAVLVRTIPVGGASVLKMLSSDNGEYVYVMTQEKILRHSVDMCGTYTSCHSCTSSPDPVCGWCVLRGRCTRQSHCSPVADNVGTPQTIWNQNTTSCPAITMATPQIIYTLDLATTLGDSPDVRLTTSNMDTPKLLQFNYKCVYTFTVPGSVSTSMTAMKDGGSFMCKAPLNSQVPPIPAGQDSVDMTVSLVVTDVTVPGVTGVTDVTLATSQTPIKITDCSVQETCTGCINSGVNKCRWCPFSDKCIPDRMPFDLCAQGEQTIGHNNQCPLIKSNGGYRIHVNHEYSAPPLLISTSDLSTFQELFDSNQFECVLCEDAECTAPLFEREASLIDSGTTISCAGSTYSRELMSPQLSAELRVVDGQDRRIDNPNDTRVTLYDCNLMGNNCGQCLAISADYDCSYCGPTQSCHLDDKCQGVRYSDVSQFDMCEAPPTIASFTPSAGPVDGGTTLTIRGTNLGAHVSQITMVTVGGVDCDVIEETYDPGVMVDCRTRSAGSASSGAINVQIAINGQQMTVTSSGQFSYLTPTLEGVSPPLGPRSGGSNITITGANLHFGSTHSVTVGGEVCAMIDVGVEGIRCTTAGGDVGEQDVRVSVDDWNGVGTGEEGFRYSEDPTFQSIHPNMSFASGGTNYTVTGTNLNVVQNPRLLIYVGVANGRRKRQTIQQEVLQLVSETCLPDGEDTLDCPAPAVDLNGSSSLTVGFGLLMDNVTMVMMLDGTLTVHSDPRFSDLSGELTHKQGEAVSITIMGEGFLFTEEQVKVRITPCNTESGCFCIVMNITNQNMLTCTVDNPSELPVDRSLTITVVVGTLRRDVGTLRLSPNLELLYILVPVIAAVVIISATVFIVLVAVFCRNARKKDQKYDQLILELERLESSVARECKLGFAELQTDLDDITEIVGCRLPYRDMQTYLLTTLFPGVKDHAVLHPIQLPQYRQPQMNRALEDFNYLIHDKKVLLLLVRSLEEERSFNIRDKSVVGSLLVVALINRFDYATDVLKSLLSDLIHKTVTNSSPKLLLRRTETVAERMLTNWLAFCLHGYIMEHVGQPLYLTYRAVKTQLEKGPVDVITGEARYSLSEQKLIRQKVDVEVVDVLVDSEDGLRVQVKLLDCDTVSQVKEKLLDATYKTAPISQRPSLKSVDLVYVESPTRQQVLRDEDVTMERDGTWKRINTLKHYGIRNGALFRLVRRKEHPGPGKAFDYLGSLISSHSPRQRALSEAEDGTRVWHLFKQLDVEDPRRSPFLNKKMVSEIYLPRMLSTKSILQKFVDDLFKSLFTISHPPVSPTTQYGKVFPQSPGVQVPMGYAPGADAVPMAVKYLFDFLDDEAEAAKISDPDVVHTWKNNALSLRFWVNMIKNPEFVFDINKSHTVDACLSVIAQAFIDGCSFADTKLNIDSPTSKLLYNKEVQGYRAQVKQYYHDIRNLPRVPEDAMQYYLKQLSVYQAHMTRSTGGFVVESALYELLRYASKYSDQIAGNLRQAGLESKAQVFSGIVKVFLDQSN